MDPARDQLVAYLATLLALVVVIGMTLFAMASGVTVSEGLGVAIAIGGLIGVLRLPQQRNVTVTNDEKDPVATKEADPPATGPEDK